MTLHIMSGPNSTQIPANLMILCFTNELGSHLLYASCCYMLVMRFAKDGSWTGNKCTVKKKIFKKQ